MWVIQPGNTGDTCYTGKTGNTGNTGDSSDAGDEGENSGVSDAGEISLRMEEHTFTVSVESNCPLLDELYKSLFQEIQENYETCFGRSVHSCFSSKANVFRSVFGGPICASIG